VLQSLTASYTGPDRVSVPIGDDGHIFVQVRFTKDGKPHRFLLDTGATYSLVSKDLMEKIRQQTQVREIGKGRVMTADGALHTVSRYKVKDVFLYNLPLGEIEVHVFAGKVKTFANLLGARSLKGVSISLDTGVKKAEIRRAGESARELEEE
jgi:predicted aspartyl protease